MNQGQASGETGDGNENARSLAWSLTAPYKHSGEWKTRFPLRKLGKIARQVCRVFADVST